MNLLKSLLFIIIVVLAIYSFFIYLFPAYAPNILPKIESTHYAVDLKGEIFNLEIARTEAEQERGLGYRDGMKASEGMLFIFSEVGKHGIWMRGMKFPLDIMWLKNKQIILIEENVSEASMDIYGNDVDSDAVIELNAGTVSKLNFGVGDRVSF